MYHFRVLRSAKLLVRCLWNWSCHTFNAGIMWNLLNLSTKLFLIHFGLFTQSKIFDVDNLFVLCLSSLLLDTDFSLHATVMLHNCLFHLSYSLHAKLVVKILVRLKFLSSFYYSTLMFEYFHKSKRWLVESWWTVEHNVYYIMFCYPFCFSFPLIWQVT